MRRVIVILALAATALIVAPTASPAATQRSCNLVAGKTIFGNSAVRIVRQKVKSGSRLLGCNRRSRTTYRLGATSSAVDATRKATLLAVNRHFVGVRQASTGPFGGGESAFVVSLRTGKGYVVAEWSFNDVVVPGAPAAAATRARALRLAADGRSAAILAVGSGVPTFDQKRTDLVAFNALGFQRQLDTAPRGAIAAGSLLVTGGTVSWTKNGVPYSTLL
jgi:hypothetical protein